MGFTNNIVGAFLATSPAVLINKLPPDGDSGIRECPLRRTTERSPGYDRLNDNDLRVENGHTTMPLEFFG